MLRCSLFHKQAATQQSYISFQWTVVSEHSRGQRKVSQGCKRQTLKEDTQGCPLCRSGNITCVILLPLPLISHEQVWGDKGNKKVFLSVSDSQHPQP